MEKHIEGTPFAGMFYTAEAFYELKANRDFSKGISLLIKSYNEFENYNDIENMVIRIPQRQCFPRFGAGAVVRFPAAPSSRCSKAALRSGRIPQRQHLPRSGAGAVVRFPVAPSSRCSKAALRSGRIPQRQHFPRFGAGAVVRFSVSPSSRCSKAVLRSGRIPQRQHFPRFGAGAADGREEEIASRALAPQAQPFCNVQHITKIHPAYYQGYTFWQLAGPGIFRYQTAILPHIFTSPADVFFQSVLLSGISVSALCWT